MARKTKTTAPAPDQPAPTMPPLAQDSKPNDIKVVMIDVDQIVVANKHDRAWTPDLEAEVRSLAESIAERGLQSPIRVYERGLLEKAGGPGKTMTDEPKYGLTYGELRLNAVRMLGWPKIPATIGSAADIEEDRAVENLQRPELGVAARMVLVGELVEKISASLRKDFEVGAGETLDARAADALRKRAVDVCQTRTGMKPEQIRDLLFLADLDGETRSLVLAERLPWQYARKLAAVADPDVRAEIAKSAAIVTTGSPYQQREQPIPLSELEKKIAAVTNLLDHVPWRLDVAFAGEVACKNCPSNSINQTGLFDGTVKARNPDGWGLRDKTISEAGVCLKDSCYRHKLATFNRATANMARKVSLTVKGADPKAKDAAKREPVSLAAPDWAKEEKFKRQVREKAKLKAEAAANPGTAGGTKVKKKASPEEIAREQHERAVDKWIEVSGKKLNKALEKDRGLRELLRIVETSEQASVFGGYNSKKPTQAHVAAVMKLVKLALLNNFGELVDAATRRDSHIYWDYFPVEAVRSIAEDLHVELTPAPELDDFLPKDKPAKPAAKKSAGKGAAPASGKKKAKKSKANPTRVSDGEGDGGDIYGSEGERDFGEEE